VTVRLASEKAALLFSGGTDSTASAALTAADFPEVHLLTYRRLGMRSAENAAHNYRRLQERFPQVAFVHRLFETTALARRITEHRRWHYLRRYGFFTLQNCGFCAVVNHVATAAYCLRHGIANTADGITRDWPFFPGHMKRVIELLEAWYLRFGITYRTPVWEYAIAEPPRYIDKIFPPPAPAPDGELPRTTGRLLLELGLSDTSDYKGTPFDRTVQATCFQFAVPNLFIFWVFRGHERWEEYERIVTEYFGHVLDDCDALVREFSESRRHAELFSFLD